MIAVRIYRALLGLLPNDLRDRHADAMCALFEEEIADARRRGPAATMGVAARGIADLLLRLPYEYRRRVGRPGRRTPNEDSYMLPVVEPLRLDIRFAWRSLRRRPVFAAVAILTIALSIGAATVMYSVVDGVLFPPSRTAAPIGSYRFGRRTRRADDKPYLPRTGIAFPSTTPTFSSGASGSDHS